MKFKNIKEKVHTGKHVKKPVRTLSGVTPLTVVLKPKKCDHGTCIYCPGGDHVPQSYTDKSPAIMRAMRLNYDPYEQVNYRLKVLQNMNHPLDKIELIVLGGTFLQYDVVYQYWFIKRCFDAMNGVDSKDLKEAKKINETASNRCVAMCIENRPDNCSVEEIKRMREFGCTRVEIGVQNPDDDLYKKINRGHSIKDVIVAMRNLKNAGFKVGYHLMPGLPFSSYSRDMKNFRMMFEYEDFRPDQLKIYPCQIVADSPLAKVYEKINYKPYSHATMKKMLAEIYAIIPEYCRIMRVMREIPKEKMVANPLRLDLRKHVEEDLKKSGVKIKEIRMREIGFNTHRNETLSLRICEYNASGGKEFFIEVVNEEGILFGLLRLRFPELKSLHRVPTATQRVLAEGSHEGENLTQIDLLKKLPELKDCALIREIHIYGQALGLGIKGEKGQHTGLGKWLMGEAEQIAREAGYKKIAVISGIGVREYYRKLGYNLVGEYMVKSLSREERN